MLFDFIKNKSLKIESLEIFGLTIKSIEDLKSLISTETSKNIQIISKNSEMITNFVEYNNLPHIEIKNTKLNNIKSFCSQNEIYICDDIISQIFLRKRIQKKLSGDIDLLLKIEVDDFVVHIDHGV